MQMRSASTKALLVIKLLRLHRGDELHNDQKKIEKKTNKVHFALVHNLEMQIINFFANKCCLKTSGVLFASTQAFLSCLPFIRNTLFLIKTGSRGRLVSNICWRLL